MLERLLRLVSDEYEMLTLMDDLIDMTSQTLEGVCLEDTLDESMLDQVFAARKDVQLPEWLKYQTDK